MPRILLAASALLLVSAGGARADYAFDFAFSDGQESLAGIITTSSVPNGDGSYTATAISGTASGVASGSITGILMQESYQSNDNWIYPADAAEHIDFAGLGFSVGSVGSVRADLFGVGGGSYGFEDSAGYNANLAITSTDFTFSPAAAVPAPPSLVMCGLGLAGVVAARFRRKLGA